MQDENRITPGDVKAYLKQCFWISKEMQDTANRLRRLISSAERTTPIISDLPHGTDHGTSRVEEFAVEIALMKEQLQERIGQLMQAERTAREMISLLDDSLQRNILIDWHINRLSPAKMALKYNYAEGYIRNLRYKAYQEIADKMNERNQSLDL